MYKGKTIGCPKLDNFYIICFITLFATSYFISLTFVNISATIIIKWNCHIWNG